MFVEGTDGIDPKTWPEEPNKLLLFLMGIFRKEASTNRGCQLSWKFSDSMGN